jgi:hypothetical protein
MERMQMNSRRFATKRSLAIGAAVLAVGVGAGAAIAETSGVFDPRAEHQAFESAVAKHLGVTTQQLENAYKAAALERLDAAVAAGRITKEQADTIRSRIESGGFLGPFGMLGGPGMHAPGGGHLSAAAAYLGIDEAALVDKLQSGQSLADVARARGKSVDGLKQALVADEKKELDQAVEDGRLTDAQRDELLARIEAHVDDMVNGTGPPAVAPPFGAPFGQRFQGPHV